MQTQDISGLGHAPCKCNSKTGGRSAWRLARPCRCNSKTAWSAPGPPSPHPCKCNSKTAWSAPGRHVALANATGTPRHQDLAHRRRYTDGTQALRGQDARPPTWRCICKGGPCPSPVGPGVASSLGGPGRALAQWDLALHLQGIRGGPSPWSSPDRPGSSAGRRSGARGPTPPMPRNGRSGWADRRGWTRPRPGRGR